MDDKLHKIIEDYHSPGVDDKKHYLNSHKEYAAATQLFLLNEIVNNGLQLRRGNDKNTIDWWYADGSNAEGESLDTLLAELNLRSSIREA